MPDSTPCDDGSACTLDDTDQQGQCTGTPGACGTADGPCDPATDACTTAASTLPPTESVTPIDLVAVVETIRDAIPDGSPCDDGDPCTVDDVYHEGVCSGTALSYTECTALTGAACENVSGEPSDEGGT
jgi:hypothetical protein